MELKLDSSAEVALEQIRSKEYFKPYLNQGKDVLILGANFSSNNRNISQTGRESSFLNPGKKIKDIFPEKSLSS